MRSYSLNELFRLTRFELFDLHGKVVTELSTLHEAAPERTVGYANLQLIRRVLARATLTP